MLTLVIGILITVVIGAILFWVIGSAPQKIESFQSTPNIFHRERWHIAGGEWACSRVGESGNRSRQNAGMRDARAEALNNAG